MMDSMGLCWRTWKRIGGFFVKLDAYDSDGSKIGTFKSKSVMHKASD